ncbi:hypothetical protein M885DRAFT_526153 [Pelagophyceae sp. CCMP2097]|nr:hypothetical protein M885DRAFT_526153 [Pelagophyceae sp. CCMP2097]
MRLSHMLFIPVVASLSAARGAPLRRAVARHAEAAPAEAPAPGAEVPVEAAAAPVEAAVGAKPAKEGEQWDGASFSGLKWRDTFINADGEPPSKGDYVVVDYVGKLAKTGFVFDSSFKRGIPFIFEVGGGKVIPGWDEGVGSMREGSNRTLWIPARLAYGEENIGGGLIPPNSDLKFEVVLREVRRGFAGSLATKVEESFGGITQNFGPNPFTFFTVALVLLFIAPSILSPDHPLLKVG